MQIQPLLWKVEPEVPLSTLAILTAGAQFTVLLLSCSLQFKCAPGKKHVNRDVWPVNMGSKNITGTWRILEWENWSSFDLWQLQVECVFVFFVVFFLITMCEEWMWVGCQFIFVTDTRTGELSAWITEGRVTDINVKFDFWGRTMAKRKGLLFSLLYFMAEFWLTSQQVLRIGECWDCQIFLC